MTVDISLSLQHLVGFFSFTSGKPLYKVLQIIIWIIFGIPYSALILTLVIVELIRVLIFSIGNLMALTVVLIPVTYLLQSLCCSFLFPIIKVPIYLISELFNIPNKVLDKHSHKTTLIP